MERRVPFDDLETSEWSEYHDVTWQGKPFTGIAVEQCPLYTSEYRFRNGLGHGACVSRYANGQLREQFTLKNGKPVGDQYEWYADGTRKAHRNERFARSWSENGTLLSDRDLIAHINLGYRTSGELLFRTGYVQGVYQVEHFGRDGEWVCRHTEAGNVYNGPAILRQFPDLLAETEQERPPCVFGWLGENYAENPTLVLGLLEQAFATGNRHLQDQVVLCVRFHKIYEGMPLLQKALKIHRRPADVRSREGVLCHHGRTIAEQAAVAMRELEESQPL